MTNVTVNGEPFVLVIEWLDALAGNAGLDSLNAQSMTVQQTVLSEFDLAIRRAIRLAIHDSNSPPACMAQITE